MTTEGIRRRGFASMSPERRTEIARKGGRKVQANGTGHQWDTMEAQAAGRKGRAKQLEPGT
jgi:general stress protein YciG